MIVAVPNRLNDDVADGAEMVGQIPADVPPAEVREKSSLIAAPERWQVVKEPEPVNSA